MENKGDFALRIQKSLSFTLIRKYSQQLSLTLTNRVQARAENISLSLVVGSLLFCYAIERYF